MDEYISGNKASKILDVHQRTLHNWDEHKQIDTIRTPGGKRLYNVKKYLVNLNKNQNIIKSINKNENENNLKIDIIYARVSSLGQKNDLDRQIDVLKNKYPKYKLITDIGSGMNMNRKGLRRIIDYAIQGLINEIVVVHKDRLCRFGYELVRDLIEQYSNGKIVIIERKENKEPKEELVEDVLQIMNIFVAKMNVMRNIRNKIYQNATL
jgi:hypothetical protein